MTTISLLVRTPVAVSELRSSQNWAEAFTDETDGGDNWRAVFFEEDPGDLDETVQAYAAETGCPAMIFFTHDEGFAMVYSAIPGDQTRMAILGLRTAIAAGLDTSGYQVGETRQELLAWAAAAGTAPHPEKLDTALFHDGGEGLGVRLMVGLLAGLGIPDFRDTNPLESEGRTPEKAAAGSQQEVGLVPLALVRSSTKISKLRAGQAWPGDWGKKEKKFKKGWRVASAIEWPEDTHDALHAFFAETGGPALLAFVADAGFVIVRGTSRAGEFWETVLGLDAAHAVGHCTEYDESDLYRFYTDSRDWSADAGLTIDELKLRAAYERSGGMGEEYTLVYVLLAGLGIPGCEKVPADWDGSPLQSSFGGWVIQPTFEITIS